MALILSEIRHLRGSDAGKQCGQCPACAEAGKDRHAKNHLVIWPSGQFACVAHPGDKQHRRRIFELIGDKRPRAVAVPMAAVRRGWLGKGVAA